MISSSSPTPRPPRRSCGARSPPSCPSGWARRPGDQQLRRQLLRVYQADIKTVDAFCTSLLRENTHLLAREGDSRALTPDFRVLDDNEAQLIRQRVLSRTLEDFYDQLDEGRGLLADTLGAGRDDSRLARPGAGAVRQGPEPRGPAGWLAENRTVWGGWEGGFDDTPYAAELLAAIRRKGAHWGGPGSGPPPPGPRGTRRCTGGTGRSFSRCLWPLTPWAQVQTWEAARQTEAAVAFPRAFHPQGAEGRAGHCRAETGVGAVQGGGEEAGGPVVCL